MMMKRKLQPFYGDGFVVYVIESHVKTLMKMATDGDFTSLETKIYSPKECTCKKGLVTFTYKTNYSTGHTSLEGQKVVWL